MRRRLGFIFQAHNLHDSLTARQNVMMGLQVPRPGAIRAGTPVRRITFWAFWVLGERLDYLPGNLSGGQKQRVAIRTGPRSNPDIIFADEPTAALEQGQRHGGGAPVQAPRPLPRLHDVMVTHDPRILDLGRPRSDA